MSLETWNKFTLWHSSKWKQFQWIIIYFYRTKLSETKKVTKKRIDNLLYSAVYTPNEQFSNESVRMKRHSVIQNLEIKLKKWVEMVFWYKKILNHSCFQCSNSTDILYTLFEMFSTWKSILHTKWFVISNLHFLLTNAMQQRDKESIRRYTWAYPCICALFFFYSLWDLFVKRKSILLV